LGKIRAEGFFCHDSWQAQIHALICEKAKVYFYSDNLSDEQIRNAFMQPCRDIAETVNSIKQKQGGNLKICVLPEGPLTIPYLAVPPKNVFP
jgi:nickel-dependent lactate racemase